ncbi:MAG: oxygen-independent coproporphyrinogen III oxidase, partial [Crocinitomicaceae bacterium]|nr:oxygen-independent coproporphyrinogen III oxidase [Crocinitomicaceae bacterium]
MSTNSFLLNKYNVPVPRYTSYPTVPYWNDRIDTIDWQNNFKKEFGIGNAQNGISLYLHLPFCESLCTYCGCYKKITDNHNVEDPYIKAIHTEWQLYKSSMDGVPVIRELHLGGGTPTFFSPENLRKLLQPMLSDSLIHEQADFSFEGHPNNTTVEHLQVLFDLGFRRVSFGVQDNNPKVQHLINRIQPFENVQRAIETARKTGYESVNFDLIYGLPGQTIESILTTIEETISLRPDRIAFYSYAHVPWTSKGQRLFDENDLPKPHEKIQMYAQSRTLFLNDGYHDIGMDHFALETDTLYKAHSKGKLHRNFMGYTTHNTEIMLGLGVSAISTLPGAYMQNEKNLHNYYKVINDRELPVSKGYFLNAEDIQFRNYINELICTGHTDIRPEDSTLIQQYVLPVLKNYEADGLVEMKDHSIIITTNGRDF